MIFALRMLGDLALYFYFAGIVGGVAGSQTVFYLPMLWCAAAAGLSFLLRERGWFLRCLPYVLVGLSWFSVKERVDAILLIIPLVYLLYTSGKGLYYMERNQIMKHFKLFIKIMPVMMLGLTVDASVMEKFCLPYGLLYVSVSVYLMRLLRHDEDILRQTRFRLLNGLELAGICMVGLAISSPVFVQGVKWIIQYVVVPLLTLPAVVFIGIFMLFYKPTEAGDPQMLEELKQTKELGEAEWRVILNPPTDTGGAVQWLTVLATIGIALLLFFLMRRLLGNRQPAKKEEGAIQHRAFLVPQEKYNPRLKKSNPRDQIRLTYQRFLKMCRQYGLVIPVWFTSENVKDCASLESWCDGEESEQLREIYLKARYSDGEITAEDARQAVKGFARLRSQARALFRSSKAK